MTDEMQPEPVPASEPVPPASDATEPVPVVSAPVPEVAAATTAAPVPAANAAAAAPSGSSTKRNRVAGLTAQAAGVIGIVLFVALAVVMLLGRGWATSRVDQISGDIDAKMAQAVPLLDTASTRVSEINGRVGALTDAANTLAGQAEAAGPGILDGLRAQLSNLQSKYLEFRAGYTDLRSKATSAIDTLKLLERVIPGFTVPQGPVDALNTLDGIVQEVDAKITDASAALTDGPAQKLAATVAEKSATLQAGLGKVTTGLDNAQAKLAELRTQVADTTSTITTFINIGSILLFLLFLYFAFLHWVLFRTGRGLTKAAAA